MKPMPHDLRQQTLDLVRARAHGGAPVDTLIEAWLAAIDGEDLVGTQPASLAPALSEGFAQLIRRSGHTCQIARLSYHGPHGEPASALLLLNDDMPWLVDSFVMAVRRQRVAVHAVLNAVLPVHRNQAGQALGVGEGGQCESYVLCLLGEALGDEQLSRLAAVLQGVAADAAVVSRDAGALGACMDSVAHAAGLQAPEGSEVAAFLQWARSEGFEPFGYAYYRVRPGERELERDLPSRIGLLQDLFHPVYGTCLANIPGDYHTLAGRAHALSIVKADVLSTLHRDTQLDFIGVREQGADGSVAGEHCFIGLFTRAAAATPLDRLPFVRGRVAEVLRIGGVRPHGFRAEKFIEVLESLPRTEAVEADPDWLAQVCGAVVSLYKQPRARVFARRDVYARHLNVLVYLPRERFGTAVASMLAQALKDSSGASDVRAQTLLADGPLARVYLTAHAARYPLDLERDIEGPLLSVLEGWHDRFAGLADSIGSPELRPRLRRLAAVLPASYVSATVPEAALLDLQMVLRDVQPGHVSVRVDSADPGRVAIRLYSGDGAPALSRILPALHNAGVMVEHEQAFWIDLPDGGRTYITSLMVDVDTAVKLSRPEVAEVACELFEALFNDAAEDGRLNGLVLEGGLSTREVQLVRAYLSYWRQAGCKFTVRYMADTLRRVPLHVRDLVDGFLRRFDPAASEAEREAATSSIAALRAGLAALNHVDSEEILAALADLMLATVRTNWYQNGAQGDRLVFKLKPGKLAMVPEPRPFREIFVFARRFEGVHLRGGPVARGGLRWSDRMEDYRTEVLGLVKAQMVKNAVIVPAGSKGGFVCKQVAPGASREVVAAEGQAVYRLYVSSLLDLTDNRVRGQVVPPPDTVRYDEDDTYLVVAADKGTATFSDLANSIAVERGFWLGDAFASGGSNGYDHKKMGITAKGAFEAVKRHFFEMGHDITHAPFTVVGVGDMSGDVFGNGMLLSRQIKLVAAFDHRHIFIDPDPDPAVSHAERTRLFALPRSSWDDYNKILLSPGGMVVPRSARSVELSPQAKTALGIEEDTLTPEELMNRILRAPVDLFYNGGIGTYIKASSETHAQVKDRANDAIRVDGNQLRCRVVTEGGNLGATQAGRIEYALGGGRIFTDAIDNSAGVDCSDHEVNLKIWLDTEVAAGRLDAQERNRLLTAMADDVERLVLRDNTLQTHLLVREAQGQHKASVVDAYAALIGALDAEKALSRKLEQLPAASELQRRKTQGIGLTTPELAVVVANVKNRYKRLLGMQTLTSHAWAASLLRPYFPPELVVTRNPLDHPLANPILATVLANEAVNRCGPLLLRELAEQHGVGETEVLLAWAQAWSVLRLQPLFDALDAHSLQVPVAVSVEVDARCRSALRAAMVGVLALPADQREGAGMGELAQLFGHTGWLEQLAQPASGNEYLSGLPDGFSSAWRALDAIDAVAPFLFAAVGVARPRELPLADFLQLGLRVRHRLGIDRLERGLKLPAGSPSQERLRVHALQALQRTQMRLLAEVLAEQSAQADAQQVLDALAARLPVVPQAADLDDLEQAMLAVWTLSEAPLARAA